MLKLLTVWITTNWKILKRDGNTRPYYLSLEKPGCRTRNTVRTGHGTMNWFKIGKGVHQGVYCHPAYLTYMQITSCEMPGWTNHKLESIARRQLQMEGYCLVIHKWFSDSGGKTLWGNMKTQIPTTMQFILHEKAIVGRAPCSIIHLLSEGKLRSTGVQVWLKRQIFDNGL